MPIVQKIAEKEGEHKCQCVGPRTFSPSKQKSIQAAEICQLALEGVLVWLFSCGLCLPRRLTPGSVLTLEQTLLRCADVSFKPPQPTSFLHHHLQHF